MLLQGIKTKIIVSKSGHRQEVRMTDDEIASERAKKAGSKSKAEKPAAKPSGPSE